jgi:hypothetical protein
MDTITDWSADITYAAGATVLHDGKVYEKLADGDQSPPDDIGGGWKPRKAAGLESYRSVAAVLDGYEERVKQHQAKLASAKASAKAKLTALGLTVEELQALGL